MNKNGKICGTLFVCAFSQENLLRQRSMGMSLCCPKFKKKTNDKKVYEFKAKKNTNRLAKPSKCYRYSPFCCNGQQAFFTIKEKK